MKKNWLILLIFLFVLPIYKGLFAQIKGNEPDFKPDSVIVFNPVRPLLTNKETQQKLKYAYGGDFLFAESGFGFGFFWEKKLNENYSLIANLYIGAARNTDEIDYINPFTGEYAPLYKKNRIYSLPLTVGIKRFVFANLISETFKPFISAGLGANIILKLPYLKSYPDTLMFDTGFSENYYGFFSSIPHTSIYVRPTGYIGIGAEYGSVAKSVSRVEIRYYFSPAFGNGFESLDEYTSSLARDSYGLALKDPITGDYIKKSDINGKPISGISPIKNFGGIFLSVSWGLRY